MMLGDNGGLTLMQAITISGLTSNLKLCLDAGDAASYTSGVPWLDRSGGGYDFNRGDGATSTTYPTFNGTAGVPTAYWSFDGGDYFTYDTTNETWMQNLHKNNANFTIIYFVYRGASSTTYLLSTNDTSGTGSLFAMNSNSKPGWTVSNAGSLAIDVTADSAANLSAWNMIGLSVNEATGAGGGFHYLNGAYNKVAAVDTFDSTYTSPASGSATNTMQLMTITVGAVPAPSGTRLSGIAAWSTALTKANMDTIRTAMRGRFGI